MFRGAEYLSFGGGDVVVMFDYDEHHKFDAFIKKT